MAKSKNLNIPKKSTEDSEDSLTPKQYRRLQDATKQLEEHEDLYESMVSLSEDLNELAKKNITYKNDLYIAEKKIQQLYFDRFNNNEQIDKLSLHIAKIEAEQLKSIVAGNAKIFNSKLAEYNLIKKFPQITDQELSHVRKIYQTLEQNSIEYNNHKKDLDYINEQYKEAAEHIDGVKTKFKNYYLMLKEMVTSPKFSLAIFIGAAALKAKDLFDAVHDVHKELGLTMGEMVGLGGTLAGTTFSPEGLLSGVGFKEGAEASKALVDNFGTLNAVTHKNVLETGKLMSLYGLSADEAANITRLTKDASGYNLDGMKALAKANKVPIGSMMKDVAKNADYFAIHSKDGGKNIFQASIYAKKLGLELSTIDKLTTNMLDDPTAALEKSLNTSVMLGKQIDISGVQQALFDGDHNKALKEIQKQLGTNAKFENLSYYQKKAVLDMTGMTATEAKKLMDSDKENLSLVEKAWGWWDKMDETTKGMIKTTKDFGLLLISGLGTLVAMVMQYKQMKAMQVMSGTGGGGNMIQNIFGFGKGKKPPVPGGGAIDPKAAYLQKMRSIGANAPSLGGGADKGIESASKSVSKLGMNMKNIALGAAAAAMLAGALYILANALVVFNQVEWDSIAKGALGLGILVGGLFLLSKFMEAGAEDMFVGALAIAALGAALIPFGIAMGSLANVDWKTLMSVPSVIALIAAEMFSMGALMMTGIGAIAFLAGAAAIAALGAALIPLGDAIGKMAPGLPSFVEFIKTVKSVSDIGTTVGDFFSSMASGVEELTKALEGLSKYNDTLGKLTQLAGTTVAPAIPRTGAMTSPGGVSGPTAATAPAGSGGMSDSKADIMIAKLNELINAVSRGASVEIDGVKFLRYLNKNTQPRGTESTYTSGKGNY